MSKTYFNFIDGDISMTFSFCHFLVACRHAYSAIFFRSSFGRLSRPFGYSLSFFGFIASFSFLLLLFFALFFHLKNSIHFVFCRTHGMIDRRSKWNKLLFCEYMWLRVCLRLMISVAIRCHLCPFLFHIVNIERNKHSTCSKRNVFGYECMRFEASKPKLCIPWIILFHIDWLTRAWTTCDASGKDEHVSLSLCSHSGTIFVWSSWPGKFHSSEVQNHEIIQNEREKKNSGNRTKTEKNMKT